MTSYNNKTSNLSIINNKQMDFCQKFKLFRKWKFLFKVILMLKTIILFQKREKIKEIRLSSTKTDLVIIIYNRNKIFHNSQQIGSYFKMVFFKSNLSKIHLSLKMKTLNLNYLNKQTIKTTQLKFLKIISLKKLILIN